MITPTDTTHTALVDRLSQAGVRHALASFVDAHGVPKAKAVPLGHLPQMLAGSELFTGAALDGVPQHVNDEEVSAHPDPASATVLPWNREIAWLASDLYVHGVPFPACSRGILRRVVADAADLGYTLNLGVETEFYVLRRGPDGRLEPLSDRDHLDKPCYDVRGLLDNYTWASELVAHMDALGWDVYSWDHEDGNGQFETDFAYSDVLTMADRVVFFRLMAAEIARRHGLIATFMPKPFGHRTGSGAHMNMSIADADTGANLFLDPHDERGCMLSELGYRFVGGILAHAPAICAMVAPTVNSYKRLVARGNMSGFTWAPIQVSYGFNNRTNMLRIPLSGGRVECRAADISMNPYLASALMYAAGLEGIRDGVDPGMPHQEDMYTHGMASLERLGISLLPRTLGEAIDALAEDPLARRVLGDEMHASYLELKREEWDAYHRHVSDWETDRYLTFFS